MATRINTPTGNLVSAGQSITGSFHGFIVLSLSGSTSPANFAALKDFNGSLITGSNLFIPQGANINFLHITSASLAAGSAPVLFYN
jgi:hypothetical protein